MTRDWACCHCGATVKARKGYELTAALTHSRAAGHPDSGLKSLTAHHHVEGHRPPPPLPAWTRSIKAWGLVGLLAFAVFASWSHAQQSGEPENDRQRCERTSPQDDVISFGDCKDMFPGQPGISGWD